MRMYSMKTTLVICGLFMACASCLTLAMAADEKPPVDTRPLSPEEAIKTIQVPDGYRLELVASEPMIAEPVLAVWDGQGRMYVAEMRTYMQNIDGKDQHKRTSRVSLLQDTDGDGKMDKQTIFADNLLLPRMVLPLDNGQVIIRETDTFDLWSYRDTDGDGVADEKKIWHQGGPRGGNLEHQPSGLIWNLDNWIYTTYSRHRYRATGGNVVREPLPHGSGQWGLSHDDVGNLYYSTGGGENPAMDFQRPIIYGRIQMPGEKVRGFEEVFPLVHIPDVQGGRGRVRPNDTLNHFTGCAGQSIFRGDRLPGDLYGDLIIPEPVGRLIRRAKVTNVDGKTVLSNAYDKKEFIVSTDPNFRPLNSDTGPDGCLYIVDMYRGIIQEGNWVGKGSYLRGVVEKYKLQENIGRGRIYRLVHKDHKRDTTQPRMFDQKAIELIPYLSHPNGWWRDTAQKLLVLRRDAATIAPLKTLAGAGESPLGRLHALWTLEGMDVLDEALLTARMEDADPRVRAAAVRISERLIQQGNTTILSKISQAAADKDPNVSIQVMLTAQYTQMKELDAIVNTATAAHPKSDAVVQITKSYSDRIIAMRDQAERDAELAKRSKLFKEKMTRAETTYKTLCFVCHGPDGKGAPTPGLADMPMAPSLVNSERVLGSKERLVRIILHGLVGPVDGKTYLQPMIPMGNNDDQWIADIATYIRNSFGNQASLVEPREVKVIREASKARATPWTLKELHAFDPVLRNQAQWKVTASHNSGGARRAIDGKRNTRWETATSMRPGMWYQIELPQAQRIKGLILDAASSGSDFPRKYSVTVSTDGKTWSKPVAEGVGVKPLTEITFDPVGAKFIRITQNGSTDGLFWSIHQLDVLSAEE